MMNMGIKQRNPYIGRVKPSSYSSRGEGVLSKTLLRGGTLPTHLMIVFFLKCLHCNIHCRLNHDINIGLFISNFYGKKVQFISRTECNCYDNDFPMNKIKVTIDFKHRHKN